MENSTRSITDFENSCRTELEDLLKAAEKSFDWDNYISMGDSAQVIAGEHEGRYLLELLQNARDAIAGQGQGETPAGRILIFVTPTGLGIANTGKPFDLTNAAVKKAVTLIGHSSKVGQREYIGHKGIGLKSILLQAEAFSIHSTINLEGHIHAYFARSLTAEALLKTENWSSYDWGQQQHILVDLPRLPLFRQAFVECPEGSELRKDLPLIESLLSDTYINPIGLVNGLPVNLDHYQTVVYLPFKDKKWHEILDEQEIVIKNWPDSSKLLQEFQDQRKQREVPADSYQSAWDELTDPLNGLDPRIYILLGNISEVQYLKFDTDLNILEARQISIGHPKLVGITDIELAITDFRVRYAAPFTYNRSFCLAETPFQSIEPDVDSETNQQLEAIRLLVEIPQDDRPVLKEEPLFLYYPIKDSPSGLPFLVHGPFHVIPNRTKLSDREKEWNLKVLEQAGNLLIDRLPALLGHPRLRNWMPWVILPQSSAPGISKLYDQIIASLVSRPCIPSSQEGVNLVPYEAVFLPDIPQAFELLENVSPTKQRLLVNPIVRTHYEVLSSTNQDLSKTVALLKLGEFSIESFVDDLLISVLSREESDRESLSGLDQEKVNAFFRGLYRKFSDEALPKGSTQNFDRFQNLRGLAQKLGDANIFILPVKSSNSDQTWELARAISGTGDDSNEEHQSKRLIFRKSQDRAISKENEVTRQPPNVKVYFIDPVDYENDRSEVQDVLDAFSMEWGTTKFANSADLFRNISERLDEMEYIEQSLPVLGYLAALLELIGSNAGDDLQPRPYAAVDISYLADWLGSDLRNSRKILKRMQYWMQIQVPCKNLLVKTIKQAVFGEEWAYYLESLPNVSPDKDGTESNEMKWARAIRALSCFRKANKEVDGCFEIAPPDDPIWKPALEQANLVWQGATEPGKDKLALFRLLLLFGVRLGPRVEWLWFDRGVKDNWIRESGAINFEMSRAIFDHKNDLNGEDNSPLFQSSLLSDYCDFITLIDYHPKNTLPSLGKGNYRYKDWYKPGKLQDYDNLTAWIWYPDLVDISTPDGVTRFTEPEAAAFRNIIIASFEWIKNSLVTGWYCGLYGGHYIYEKGIPSFAWYQLTRMPLWESSFPELSPEFSGQLFPACVMIPWNNAEKKKLPSGDGPESHFPLMDISDEDFKNLAKYLEITSFIDMNFPGAAERLRWLLEQAAQDPGSVSSGCWDLDGDRIRANSWSQAENMLLDAFFRKMPQDLWGKDAVAKCRLTLQAVQANKADQKAVQVIRGKDNEEIAFPVSLYYFNGS